MITIITSERGAKPEPGIAVPHGGGTGAKARPSRAGQTRRPQQKRSLERFEAILDAAARLLATHDADGISLYTIAEEAKMPPASVYHFFPDGQHVFIALAERFFSAFSSGTGRIADDEIENWQDFFEFYYESSRAYYNLNPAARKLILGSAISWTIRVRDIEIDHVIARAAVAELSRLFEIEETPALIDRMVETIVMNDALWSLAIHKHGLIDDVSDAYARRARIAHMQTYLPEDLARRPIPGVSANATLAPRRRRRPVTPPHLTRPRIP